MLLMIDNYDSFTYNLVQYFGELGEDVRVARNDEITLEEIASLRPERICISPGPCSPSEAGISLAVLQRFAGEVPILGVCLGHQAIGQAFGGRVIRAKALMHGKTGTIHHTGALASSPDCPTLSPPPVTTRWPSSVLRCPSASRSRPGPTMTRSWDCATGRWRSKACSSTRSRSRPSTGTRCSRIS